MVTCPKCERVSDGLTSFCTGCGERLLPSAITKMDPQGNPEEAICIEAESVQGTLEEPSTELAHPKPSVADFLRRIAADLDARRAQTVGTDFTFERLHVIGPGYDLFIGRWDPLRHHPHRYRRLLSALDSDPSVATIAYGGSDVDKFIVQEYGQDKTVLLGETVADDGRCIQLDVWRRVVDAEGKDTGRCVRVAGRPVVEVMRELDRRLTSEDLIDEYFAMGQEYQYAQARKSYTPVDWPASYRWIACYAVRGGSEGHYTHVDLIMENGKQGSEADWVRVSLAMIKTFKGMEHARTIAARCADHLGA